MSSIDETDDGMRPEYGPEVWKNAERGKYYRLQLEALRQKVENSVELAPDVRKAFPTEEAVNEALRRLMQQTDVVAQPENVSAPATM